MSIAPGKLTIKSVFTVFTLSMYTIILELVLSRMSAFYLNYANAFLAIPITLFGLAIGSMHVHLSKKELSHFSIPKNMIGLTISSFFSFAVIFFVFSRFFQFIKVSHRFDVDIFSPIKIFIFSFVFIVLFYFVGKILTIMFTRHRDEIGKLYGYDLTGAALGCFIAPLMFHFLDLPFLIVLCFVLICALTVYLGEHRKPVIMGTLGVVIIGMFFLISFLERNYEIKHVLSPNRRAMYSSITELSHRWNEFSRVSVLKMIENNNRTHYSIIHDNGESNVGVIPFNPNRLQTHLDHFKRGMPRLESVPFLLNRGEIRDVLVMFAGCGKQMIEYYDYSMGKANITGVEINPLVKDLALETAELQNFRLQEFYDKPNVNLEIKEGRYFLDNDDNRYDVIYVSSDAATNTVKTGHSKKYLDTYEAMKEYVEHLKENGVIIFHAQPARHKILAIKKIFEDQGRTDFPQCAAVYSGNLNVSVDLAVISLKPFSESEKKLLQSLITHRISYVPGYKRNRYDGLKLVKDPVGDDTLVTDDQPFIYKLDFKRFSIFPKNRLLVRDHRYYSSWIKIMTLISVTILIIFIITGLYLKKVNMPPKKMFLFLLFTGFAYMLVQISYMAKLELFLGSPLLSMALLLCVFLLSNGLGSTLFHKVRDRISIIYVLPVISVIIIATIGIINLVTAYMIGFPLLVKIILTILIIFPAAFCLGLFYPYVVTWLNENNRKDTIPITYGISTLSSVLGATYAMTMIINFGYTLVIVQAICVYCVLFGIIFVYDRLIKS